jgi:hypothetical protein
VLQLHYRHRLPEFIYFLAAVDAPESAGGIFGKTGSYYNTISSIKVECVFCKQINHFLNYMNIVAAAGKIVTALKCPA